MTCCKSPSYALECQVSISFESKKDPPFTQRAGAGCTWGYTLVGCAGWHKYNDVNGMFISTVGSNDYCYASSSDASVWASAVWYVLCFVIFWFN